MSDTIMVKPHPKHLFASALKHPHSGPIVGHDGKVPDDGKAWLYDGFTCRMLTDGAIVRADDPMFAPPPKVDLPAKVEEPSNLDAPKPVPEALPRPSFGEKAKPISTDAPAI